MGWSGCGYNTRESCDGAVKYPYDGDYTKIPMYKIAWNCTYTSLYLTAEIWSNSTFWIKLISLSQYCTIACKMLKLVESGWGVCKTFWYIFCDFMWTYNYFKISVMKSHIFIEIEYYWYQFYVCGEYTIYLPVMENLG